MRVWTEVFIFGFMGADFLRYEMKPELEVRDTFLFRERYAAANFLRGV